jgi:hypothetical protein
MARNRAVRGWDRHDQPSVALAQTTGTPPRVPRAIFQNDAITFDLRIQSPFADIMFKTDAWHRSSGGLDTGKALRGDERDCFLEMKRPGA